MSIETPCVNLCVIDGVTGYCIGCGRTGDEIADWLALSRNARVALMAKLPERLEKMTSRAVRGRPLRGSRTPNGNVQ